MKQLKELFEQYAMNFEAMRYIAYLEGENLLPMLEFILSTNSAATAHYHNNHHMFVMAYTADSLYLSSIPTAVQSQRKALAIACLWHDYNHSAGNKPDSDNINESISHMTRYLESSADLEVYLKQASRVIKSTEYPFCRNPATLIAKCARDADLLYTRTGDHHARLKGLYLELFEAGKVNLSWPEFVYSNSQWLSQQRMFTWTAQSIVKLFNGVILSQLAGDNHGRYS